MTVAELLAALAEVPLSAEVLVPSVQASMYYDTPVTVYLYGNVDDGWCVYVDAVESFDEPLRVITGGGGD